MSQDSFTKTPFNTNNNYTLGAVMKKAAFSKTLIIAFLLSVLAGYFGIAQALTELEPIPMPSVPEYSLKVVANPYDVAPTTTIDPYTGKNITTNYGYHSENMSIEITVKNQPFTSTLDASGNYTSLYYNVRFKGQYTAEWDYAASYYNASKTDYTVISINLDRESIPAGVQVDVQARVLIGHQNKMRYDTIAPLPDEMQYYHIFAGQTGDWSNTQTITIPTSTSSPEPEPFPTTLVTAIAILVVIATIALVVVISAGLLVYFKKRKIRQTKLE